MLEFLTYVISELIFYSVVKPIGVTYRWARSGFKRGFLEVWDDHPRQNYPAGAFVVIGVIMVVGIVKIARQASVG